MGEKGNMYRVLEGKGPLEDQGIDGRMVSEWILGRLSDGGCRVDTVG
jgi:hypothetical protein